VALIPTTQRLKSRTLTCLAPLGDACTFDAVAVGSGTLRTTLRDKSRAAHGSRGREPLTYEPAHQMVKSGVWAALAVAAYAMLVGFASQRFLPSGVPFPVVSSLPLQVAEGFVNGILLGVFFPSAVLVPALVVVAQLRLSVVLFVTCVAVGYISVYVGAALGHVGSDYLTPFWGTVASAIINLPLLALTTICVWVLATRTNRIAPR
jgi:hypothetical protein